MADPIDLITLDELKAAMPSLDKPSEHDTRLRALITDVSTRIESAAGRNLAARTYKPSGAGVGEENLKLNGDDRVSPTKLYFPYPPINSIVSVVMRDKNLLNPKTVTTDTIFDATSGLLVLISGQTWTLGFQNIEIELNAGYQTIPQDLKGACIKQILFEFSSETQGRVGVFSINAQGEILRTERGGLLTSVLEVARGYSIVRLVF